jgi:putative membrane protein
MEHSVKQGENLMINTLINILVYLVVSAVVIFIVGKLNLGLTVKSFGSALAAAAVIAIVGGLVAWLLGLLGISFGAGLLAAIVALIVAAVVLLVSDKFLPGMEVHGFMGAIVAAVGIGVVGWLVTWLLSLFGIAV